MTEEPTIGQSVVRSDARAKVTGEARYAVDHALPDMLFGAVVRSTRAHAAIESIDKTAALAVDGVAGVVTADDLAGLFPRFGHLVADHPILAIDKVNYMGEPVALVVAETLHAAHDGADLVDIRYRDLPVMADTDSALAEGADLIHPSTYPKGDAAFEEAITEPRNDNVAHEASLTWGDVDRRSRKQRLWSRPRSNIRSSMRTRWSRTTPWRPSTTRVSTSSPPPSIRSWSETIWHESSTSHSARSVSAPRSSGEGMDRSRTRSSNPSPRSGRGTRAVRSRSHSALRKPSTQREPTRPRSPCGRPLTPTGESSPGISTSCSTPAPTRTTAPSYWPSV